MAAPGATPLVCIVPAASEQYHAAQALRVELGCKIKASHSATMLEDVYIFPQSSVAFLLIDRRNTAAANVTRIVQTDEIMERITDFASKFAHGYVLTLAAPGNGRQGFSYGELEMRCVVQIEKPVRFLFATTPSAAARIMHDIAKAVARDQKKTVAARFETLLQERAQTQRETWVLNALAQIDGVEPPDALLLQQVAALGDIMCAGWEAIYESTALSREQAVGIEGFFSNNTYDASDIPTSAATQ